MLRTGGVALFLASLGCASTPDVADLCGVWAVDGGVEQWWLDGADLRGEGRTQDRDGEGEIVTERLALRRTRAGHAYIATPTGAEPTTFAPIDPREARFGPDPDELAPGVERLSWANYAHDFPQEIHYLLDGDRLTAIIGGPDRESGWVFERVEACTEESSSP